MIRHMREHPEADGLKSIIPAPLHPYKMWRMEEHEARSTNSKPGVGAAGKLVPVFDNAWRQQRGPDQPRQVIQQKFPVFFQDGQVDITRRRFILRPECLQFDNVWGPNLHGYVLDPRTSTDLDDPADFRRAARLYRQLQRERRLSRA